MSASSRADLSNKEFRPELLSRRGELVAWGSTLLAIAAWIYLALRGERLQPMLIFLGAFLLLSALAISFGNWVDRHTMIRIDDRGIQFENGLRKVDMRWEEIQAVHVFDSRMGKKVRVLGDQAHFDFRTLAEVQLRGKVKGRMGFKDGESILQHILDAADLKPVEQSKDAYYYTRE